MAKRPAMDLKELSLDVSSLQSRAVEQPDPVASAVEETRKPAIKLAKPATKREDTAQEARAPQKGRIGKVSVQTWVSRETRRRLRLLAIQTDVTIEEYLAKAIDEILAQHKA